jgi:8-oxo-dGTP pyrophosphatase MutT (NUDIX family)
LKRSEIRAAGAVLWRRSPGGETLEVAVVHRPQYDDWSLPKGKLHAGESELEAALREVREETGQRGVPGRSLGSVSYLKRTRGRLRPKTVSYWSMQATGGAFAPGDEVDHLRWMPLGEAPALLSHSTDREVLERFAADPPRG